MLNFAFDMMSRNDDGTHVEVRPNCQFPRALMPASDRRFTCSMLPPMCILDRHRLRCERTELLLRAGRPFVYPLELTYKLRASLVLNPELAPEIPAEVLDQVRRRRAAILVWIGHEPVPLHLDAEGRIWVFDVILKFLYDHGLPAEQVWFASGNLLSRFSFQKWLQDRHIAEAAAFRFRTMVMSPTTVRMQYRANERGEDIRLTERDDLWTFTLSSVSAAEFAERYVQPVEIAEERRSGKIRPKRFLSMNRQPRFHRQAIVSYLAGKGFLDQSIVSFRQVPCDINDIRAVPDLGEFLFESWQALHPRLPLVIDDATPDAGMVEFHRVAFGWPYRDAYFNLVTETEMGLNVSPICTEKLCKPMLNFQPFIAATTAYTLGYLNALGFKTFSSLVDEQYDTVADPIERLMRIFEQIDRLGGLSQGEARDRYFACLPELEHNREHLLDGHHELDRLFDEIEATLP
jgi:hypothetical protein